MAFFDFFKKIAQISSGPAGIASLLADDDTRKKVVDVGKSFVSGVPELGRDISYGAQAGTLPGVSPFLAALGLPGLKQLKEDGKITDETYSNLLNQAGDEAGFDIQDKGGEIARKVGSDVGRTAGTVLSFGSLPGTVKSVASAPSLGGKALAGAKTGAAQGGFFNALATARETGDVGEILKGGAFGAGTGVAFGAAIPVGIAGGKRVAKEVSELGDVGAIRIPGTPAQEAVSALTPVMPKADSKFLPTTGTDVNRAQRAFLSVRSQFNKLGENGKELAKGFEKARDIEETFNAGVLQRIPTVLKLKGKEFEEFADTLEILRKNELPTSNIGQIGLNPKIKQAVEEWSQVAPKIRNIAQEAGVDVGDLGPYYFPKNYGDLFKNQNSINKVANDMVRNGEAKNTAEALNTLARARRTHSKPFGNLEMNRVLDLPNFKKSPDVLTDYIQGASRRISMARQFGAKDEVAFDLIDKLGKEGYSADRAKELYEVAAGIKQYNPTKQAVSSGLRKFNAVRSLGTAGIANAGQSTNTATVSGIINAGKAMLKAGSGMAKKKFGNNVTKDIEFVDSIGVTADSVLKELREQYGFTGKLGKIASPFFGTVEKFNRTAAAIAGKQWADKLAAKAAKGDSHALDVLQNKLGIEGEIGSTLTKGQQAKAGRKLTELTQFKTSAQDLPAWTNSPEGKLVSQFRTFAYKQTGFMYNEVIKEAGRGNLLPLTRFLAVGIPVGYSLGKVRDKIKGRDEEDKELASEILDAFGNVGGFGLGGDAKFLGETASSASFPQYLAGTVAGPTAGYGVKTAQNIGYLGQGSETPLERQLLQLIPVAGPAISNKALPYENQKKKKKKSGSNDFQKALNKPFGR